MPTPDFWSVNSKCPWVLILGRLRYTQKRLVQALMADLVGVEDLHGVASAEFELQQFLNLLIVSLTELLVLDLQLLKVHLMSHFASLLFLCTEEEEEQFCDYQTEHLN